MPRRRTTKKSTKKRTTKKSTKKRAPKKSVKKRAPKKSVKKAAARASKPWAKFDLRVGSRRQVWNGTAYETSGHLTKSDLKYNPKTHRIVSRKRSALGKVQYRKYADILRENQFE